MGSTSGTGLTGRLMFDIKNRAPVRSILYRTFASFFENDLNISAAAMAYFGLLTLFPTMVLVLNLSQHFLGAGSYHDLVLRMRAFLPGSNEAVERNIAAIGQASAAILVGSALAVLWAGSWIFTVIERAMCRIWGTHPRSFWHGRLITIGMIGASGLLLLASLVFTAAMVALQGAAQRLPMRRLPAMDSGSVGWQVFIGLVLAVTLFGLIYRFMPNTKIRVIEVVPAAILCGSLWELAKYGFAWTLPWFHYDLLYGSIGAGVALLTWGYLSSLILLFGAQLTAVLHCGHLFGGQAADDESECVDTNLTAESSH
ncbi:MAG TPA: YihY/virulence factor BrkB family protein [Blastocatellia bacterium]|nr:YihY/virulence factor BrkB family protein [Blastocatellia bacterium]